MATLPVYRTRLTATAPARASSIRNTETFARRAQRIGTATSGFDYLRLGLAVSVLSIHSVALSYGKPVEDVYVWSTFLKEPARLILVAFFALSGFLVAGSIFRTGSTTGFFALRALRIVPALAVEVTLSALVLGPLLTVLPLSLYFQDKHFWSYGANVVGWVHFYLPGVLTDNPVPGVVNVSIWTIPYELESYLALAILMLTGIVNRRFLFLCVTIALSLLLFANSFYAEAPPFDIGAVEPRVMVLAFLAGMTVFLYRDVLPWRFDLFAASLFAALVLLSTRQFEYLAPFFAAYATVFVGLLNPAKSRLIASGDYSYGIYLYAFPIQQTVSLLLPHDRHWWLNIAIALPLTAAFAAMSWHLVEKRVLALKKRAVANRMVDLELRLRKSLAGRVKEIFEREPPAPSYTAPIAKTSSVPRP